MLGWVTFRNMVARVIFLQGNCMIRRLYEHSTTLDIDDVMIWLLTLFQLSPSIPLWQIGEWNCSLMIRYGILKCHRELASLFGKQIRSRFLL